MKKAVLFDFDGVLVDSYKYHVEAWKQVLQPLGIHVDEQTIFLSEGQPVLGIALELLKQANRTFSDYEVQQLIEKKNSYFQKHNQARFIDGVAEFLQELRQKNVRIALVTGTIRRNIESVLSPEQLVLFDAIVTDGDSERGKPYGDPYLAAAKKLQLPAHFCLVVENAPLGIAAAKAARMTCAAVTTSLDSQYLMEADYIFANMNELRKNFDKI